MLPLVILLLIPNLLLASDDLQAKYLIFVSFSMPPESIKSLYVDSKKYNATLIMRGLIDGSFKKTTKELQNLGVELQIDPNLFKEYKITKVPTIVKVFEHDFNTISGNISFECAKERLLEAK